MFLLIKVLIPILGLILCPRETSAKNKIHQGLQVTNYDSYEFLALLRVKGHGVCSSSLIGSTSMLTASHCVCGCRPSELVAHFRHLNHADTGTSEAIPASNFTMHPGWKKYCQMSEQGQVVDEMVNGFDIAVIRLTQAPKTVNKRVSIVNPVTRPKPSMRYVEMAMAKDYDKKVDSGYFKWFVKHNSSRHRRGNLPKGTKVKLLGYGLDGGKGEGVLREGAATTSECPSFLSLGEPICVSEFKEFDQWVEEGDSGGPLLSMTDMQLGVLSGSETPEEKGIFQQHFMVFARVDVNSAFILQNMR